MNVLGVTNLFLIQFEGCSTEEFHDCYCKPTQKPNTIAAISDPENRLTVSLLDGHIAKLSSKYLCSIIPID